MVVHSELELFGSGIAVAAAERSSEQAQALPFLQQALQLTSCVLKDCATLPLVFHALLL
jgi:hypothetical protein